MLLTDSPSYGANVYGRGSEDSAGKLRDQADLKIFYAQYAQITKSNMNNLPRKPTATIKAS